MTSHCSTPGEKDQSTLEGCKEWYGHQDIKQSTENLLNLFVLYLHKLGILYDLTPPIHAPCEENDGHEEHKETIRNGGILRIVLNVLILIIENK